MQVVLKEFGQPTWEVLATSRVMFSKLGRRCSPQILILAITILQYKRFTCLTSMQAKTIN